MAAAISKFVDEEPEGDTKSKYKDTIIKLLNF